MKRRFVPTLLVGLAAASLSVIGPVGPAEADATPIDAGTALDLPVGVTISAVSGADDSRAVADAILDPSLRFNDFPSRGDSYLMLSTGDANDVFEGIPTSQLSTDVGADSLPDSSSVTLTVASGTSAGCLFLDFAMGTEENLGYTGASDSDSVSVVKDGVDYAFNAGRGYFAQESWAAQPRPYKVNEINYWHIPGDPLDPEPGTAETPRLAPVTGLNHVTTLDTARVPLDPSTGDQDVTITVRDANNGDLDSVAFLDNLRLGPTCDNGTGVEPRPENRDVPSSCCGIIRGVRGVGNALVYDPIPTTVAVERYDAVDNGWRSPSDTSVGLRFRWYRTSQLNKNSGNMGNWTPIPNADRQSYVPTSVDKGKVLIVLVTGVVDGRRYETFPSTAKAADWYVTLPIGDGAFTDGEGPVVAGPDGGASVGDVLTAQIGATVPRQDTYDWQWYARNPGGLAPGQSVSGATGQTLVVGENLAGKILTVRATAKRAGFSSRSWDSEPYGPIRFKTWEQTPRPTIVDDGSPANGETLSVSTGTWVPTPDSFSYQWKRNGAVISGASTATYTLRDEDAGQQVTVEVSGVKTGYALAPQASAGVAGAGSEMVGSTPTITGTPRVGEKLTGGPVSSEWVPAYATLTYTWYADRTVVQTGRSRTLLVPASYAGKRITLAVTGTKAGYESATRYSAPTAPVGRASLRPGTVRISGRPTVGQTLRASAGFWSPSPVTLTYRWKVGPRFVSGAAGQRETFTIPRSARGKQVSLVVTGSKPGYTTVTRSAVTAKVTR